MYKCVPVFSSLIIKTYNIDTIGLNIKMMVMISSNKLSSVSTVVRPFSTSTCTYSYSNHNMELLHMYGYAQDSVVYEP